MERVRLGMTGLEVSPICFGTWQLGGEWGKFDADEAKTAIRAAYEQGVNFYDTAHAYGWGIAERLLGDALAGELRAEREQLVVATKGGLRRGNGRAVRDSSPGSLREGVEASLRALDLDYVDIFQIHWPDHDRPLAAAAEALAELVEAGKIRHVGVSNFGVDELREFAATRPVETLQPAYHLFRREIEAEILPHCREHDIGVLVYGPLAHGLLTGTLGLETEFASDDWRSRSPVFRGEAYARNLEVGRRLAELAREHEVNVSQLATAWTLANPAVHVAIVGTRSAGHIAEAVAAGELSLSDDDLAAVDRIMAGAIEVSGPTPETV